MQTALKNYPEYFPLSANHTMLTIEDYKAVFAKNGLEIYNFEEEHLFACYDTAEQIKEFIRGWLSCYIPLPVELHNAYLDDVTHAMLNDTSNHKEGKLAIPYTALVIKARKV